MLALVKYVRYCGNWLSWVLVSFSLAFKTQTPSPGIQREGGLSLAQSEFFLRLLFGFF